MTDHTPRALAIAAWLTRTQTALDHAATEAYLSGWEGVHEDIADIALEVERVRQSLLTQPNARSHRRARPHP